MYGLVPHICMPCAAVHFRHWLLVQTSSLWHALLQGAAQVPDAKLQFMPLPQGPAQLLPQLSFVTTTHLLELGQRFCPLAHALSVPAFLVVPLAVSEDVEEEEEDDDPVPAACVVRLLMPRPAAAASAAAALTADALPPTMPVVMPALALPSVAVPGMAPTVFALAEPAVSTDLDVDLSAASAACCVVLAAGIANDAAALVVAAASVPGKAAVAAPAVAAGSVPGITATPPAPAVSGAGVLGAASVAPPCATALVDTTVPGVAAGFEPPHITPAPPVSALGACVLDSAPPALPRPAAPMRPPAAGWLSCSSTRMVRIAWSSPAQPHGRCSSWAEVSRASLSHSRPKAAEAVQRPYFTSAHMNTQPRGSGSPPAGAAGGCPRPS